MIRQLQARAKADILESLEERITGRYLAEDIVDPSTGEVIVAANHLVTPKRAAQIVADRC